MLTATPINNRLSGFRHTVELFTRRDEAYFGRTLEIRRKAYDESTSGYSPGHEHRKDGGTSADPVLAMIPADPYRDCASGWSWVQHRARMAIKCRGEQLFHEIEANTKANPFLRGVLQLLGEPQASFRWHNQTFTSASRMTPARAGVAA